MSVWHYQSLRKLKKKYVRTKTINQCSSWEVAKLFWYGVACKKGGTTQMTGAVWASFCLLQVMKITIITCYTRSHQQVGVNTNEMT